MGSAASQINSSGELKVFPTLQKNAASQHKQLNELGLEKQQTNPRILVSITKDNTVRISEGKSTATQTGEEHEKEASLGTTKNIGFSTDNSASRAKMETAAQTDVSLFEAYLQQDTDGRKSSLSRKHTPETAKAVNFAIAVDREEPKQTVSKESPWVDSEVEAGETDYWTDIGIQTDDDFDEYFGPRTAWGSHSVDSAKTLTFCENNQDETEYEKEEKNDEEKEKDSQSERDTPVEAGPFEKLSLEKYGKYKVRLSSDKEKCIVSSAAFLDTGDAVVIDRSNIKLKFVDKKFKYISSHDLPAKPWGVCARGVDVYVTMGNTHIQHLTVGQDMIVDPVEVFEIKGRCLGICVYGENLVVGLQIGELCLLNFRGERVGTIQLPKFNGKTCNPWHLCVTTEDNLLVTDSDAGALHCVNKKSELVFTFKGIGSPRGTAIDSQGNILVVGRDKETGSVVSILHKDVELQNMLHIEQGVELNSRILMTWEQLEFVPYCVCYRQDRTVILGGIQEALKIMKLH